MYDTLIGPDQTWALWAILLVVAAIAIYCENHFKWAQTLTGAVIGLLGAVILTNLRVIPMESPVYDTVWDYAIPLSIPMLLFRSNLRKIFSESGRMLILFLIGALGTVVGAILSHAIFKSLIPDLDQIAGMMTGSYIGGGVNFVAMSQVFHLDGAMISAATVADNFNMAIYFIILVSLPRIAFFRDNFTHTSATAEQEATHKEDTVIGAGDLMMVFATAATIVAISTAVASFFSEAIPTDSVGMNLLNQLFGNTYLIITTLTMILTTAFPKYFESIKGADEVGNFLIYIFFVVIGVPASIPLIIQTAPLLLLFCFIMVVVNMAFNFVGAKLLKFSLEEAIISSNANIGGPSTAAAMAISQGWYHLIGPGIFAGLFGYIIGNYLGTIVGNLLI